jgi:hypothetical protein
MKEIQIEEVIESLYDNPEGWLVSERSPYARLVGGPGWRNKYFTRRCDGLAIRVGLSVKFYTACTFCISEKIISCPMRARTKESLRAALSFCDSFHDANENIPLIDFPSKPQTKVLEPKAKKPTPKSPKQKRVTIDSSERKPNREVNNHVAKARRDPNFGKTGKTEEQQKRFRKTRGLLRILVWVVGATSTVLTILRWAGYNT